LLLAFAALMIVLPLLRRMLRQRVARGEPEPPLA
jgi:hypothetical protein